MTRRRTLPVDWLTALVTAREERTPAVLVTVTDVAGHSPRDCGSKMLVTPSHQVGSIGGGNLEATAVERARALLMASSVGDAVSATTWTDALTEHARSTQRHGKQCCGGRVSVLFEPFLPPPSVAIVGLGHVGVELARILERHDLDLHLIDSRAERLDDPLLMSSGNIATVSVHHEVLPEFVLADVPRETHVLVMTHDHAEDFAVLDAVLRARPTFASVGVIGSTAKWQRFRRRLLEAGHAGDLVDSITCPIGDPRIVGKEPAVIALSVAADLVPRLRSRAGGAPTHSASMSSIGTP